MTAQPDRPVRVVRLLVYTYATPTRMIDDMAHWSVAANGAHRAGDLTIRSATLPPEFIEPESPDIERKRGKVQLIIAEARTLLDDLESQTAFFTFDEEDLAKMNFLRRAIEAYEADV